MHIGYTPESVEYWLNLYQDSIKSQQYQFGGDLQGFRAFAPYHRGGGLGSFFKSLFRYAMPLLKSAGKHALITGSKVAADMSQGRKLNESFKEHGKVGASGFLHETADNLSNNQTGNGRRSRRRNRKASTLYKKKRQRSRSSFRPKKPCRAVATVENDLFN